jgi:hypothetical protein
MESTSWFQVDIAVEPEEQWDLAHDIVWGRPLPDPLPTQEYFVARGRLAQHADVINTWNALPELASPRFVAVVEDAGLTGAYFSRARVVDVKRSEESTDYQVLVPTAVIGRRRWTREDHVGGADDTGEHRLFRGYPVATETWQGEDFVRVEGTGSLLVSQRAFELLTRARLKGLQLTPASEARLMGSSKDYTAW